jgi:predicted DNA-binding protein (MmcQ/YjbR family)
MNKKEWIKAVAEETEQPEALVKITLEAGLKFTNP